MDARKDLGQRGEDQAADWYKAAGFEILARNWRCELGEIDLICRLEDMLVISEVKSRSNARFGTPIEAVTRTKCDRLRRLAVRWLATQDTYFDSIRFDVVCILNNQIEVIEAAF